MGHDKLASDGISRKLSRDLRRQGNSCNNRASIARRNIKGATVSRSRRLSKKVVDKELNDL